METNYVKSFGKNNHGHGFNLLECKFDEYEIESVSRKSSLLLSRLTHKALLAVQDLIDDKDATYEHIKAQLLNHFVDSV